ncbi:MAG: hypothetical protein ACQEV0_01070 [Bacillota bacterium]
MTSSKSEKPTSKQEVSMKNIMILYGAVLFSGLALSLVTHRIEDISGFLTFLVPAAVLYFLVLFLYFKEGAMKKIAFGIVGLIGLISVVMIFYLEISSGGH